MSKIKTSVVFKHYSQQQSLLLPPNLGELIDPTHLVRIVNDVVERMDITDLFNLYSGGGTSAYHPRMLLKVLLYAYCVKIYTGRRIAKALKHDIHFMWLSAMNSPDFRTINNFRSSRAKEVIEVLFKEMLEFLMEQSYIKMENYFCDGSTFKADANKHKMVWKKNAERFKAATEEKCKFLFEEIDKLNAIEDSQYGNKDLEENGKSSAITTQLISKQVDKLNEKLKTVTEKKEKRKGESLKKKLVSETLKITKYESQISTAGKRSGYNKTDNDASAMMMKNRVEILPAYNALAGCEDQFITGVSVHQNTNDATCFPEHLEQISRQQPVQPDNIIADSIFGTEQNYELLQEKEMRNFMKFPSFHNEQKSSYKNNPFLRENFIYNTVTDTFTCPNNQQLIFKNLVEEVHKKTGYVSKLKHYECSSCEGCPFYDECCKSTKDKNRTIKVNENLDKHRQAARENLNSEEGWFLRKQRSIEIESCFGDIKHNMGFRRFHLRGIDKVKTEFTLIAMAHNLRKIQIKMQTKAA